MFKHICEKTILKSKKPNCKHLRMCASVKGDNSWDEIFKFYHKTPYYLYRKKSQKSLKKNNKDIKICLICLIFCLLFFYCKCHTPSFSSIFVSKIEEDRKYLTADFFVYLDMPIIIAKFCWLPSSFVKDLTLFVNSIFWNEYRLQNRNWENRNRYRDGS